MMTNLTTVLTADAITHYRQCILIWGDSPVVAITKTARHFGSAEAVAASEIYKANPALQRLADDE